MTPMPYLYVEGRDDQWSVIALMGVNGITLRENCGPVIIQPTDSVSAMLEGLITFIKNAQSKRLPIGFMLDIDCDLSARWEGIKSKLVRAGYIVPADALSPDGVILQLPNAPVGFWLMPDNQRHSGKLEDFLRTLIPSDDKSIVFAKDYTKNISQGVPVESRFRDVDVEKAEMSSWLAVQNPPGLPYGTAITARILSPTSIVATRFVSWFRRLYNLTKGK